MLYVLTGSACSGKSAALAGVRGMVGLAVHDTDEVGVPPGADTAWRQRTLDRWLQRVARYQADGVDVLLAGQSPLGEVLACPSADRIDGIAVCLVDVGDGERLRRLDLRDPGRWTHVERDAFLGWAAWHRGHRLDPQHRPEVLTEGGWEGMVWRRWSSWTAGDPRWTAGLVDTTHVPPATTVARVRAWIEGHRSADR